MTPLLVGIVLIVGGIAFAAAPLLRRRSRDGGAERADRPERTPPSPRTAPSRDEAALQLAEAPTAPSAALLPPALPASIAVALDELELDRAMGKLGDRDYEELRASLLRDAERAVAAPAIPASASGEGAVEEGYRTVAAAEDDVPPAPPTPAPVTTSGRDLATEAEALVASLRQAVVACPDCGPRPEPSAPFCSNCGRALAACPDCGARIAQPGARFCDRCGTALTR